MGGHYIDFYTTFEESFQSVFGQAPTFEPSSIYYGMLMAIYCTSNSNKVYRASTIDTPSANIKSYFVQHENVLIINKDIN